MKQYKDIIPVSDPVKLGQLEQLFALYQDWNAKINVISRKDIENLNAHHVLHSLAISRFISFKDNSRIMDLGTGGGFPGIPLAIVFPECQFDLIDSRAKKLKVIQAVVDELGLKNVKTIHERAENIKSKYHFVVSRAVASLEKLILWSEKLIANDQFNTYPNGLLCLKGGNLKEELKSIPRYLDPEVIELFNYFNFPYYKEKHLVYIPI